MLKICVKPPQSSSIFFADFVLLVRPLFFPSFSSVLARFFLSFFSADFPPPCMQFHACIYSKGWQPFGCPLRAAVGYRRCMQVACSGGVSALFRWLNSSVTRNDLGGDGKNQIGPSILIGSIDWFQTFNFVRLCPREKFNVSLKFARLFYFGPWLPIYAIWPSIDT